METRQNIYDSGKHVEDSIGILREGVKRAGGKVSLASSFSAEDIVVIDLLKRAGVDVSVFALDTGRLPEETYQTAEAVKAHFDLDIDWYFPDREEVEKLEREKGVYSFRGSLDARKECCRIRKVVPLKRALEGLGGWVTGLRADQSETRRALDPIEIDTANKGIIKINPLAKWSSKDVREYVAKRGLPTNNLYSQGYASIGCAPCTRAISENEHERAGRWWWESPEHKECGLHPKGEN